MPFTDIISKTFKRRIITIFASVTVLGASATAVAPLAQAQIGLNPSPDLYVVMFRADWCAPCKVVEPTIQKALNTLRDPKIEYLTIDISNPGLSEISAHAAFDREIVPQYNSWLGVTGFAAIIDADTKRTLGCVNMLYDQNATTTHIRNLKTIAIMNKPSLDLTCPDQITERPSVL